MEFAAMIETFLDMYGLAAIFGVMLLKEIGIPIPVPADLIMLGAAARAAQGKFHIAEGFLAILIPMVVGGLVQYWVARGPGRRAIYRLGRYIGLSRERLDRAMAALRRGGATAVAAGLSTPGVRVAIVPASGLAELPLPAFVPGLVAGSAFFLAWHFAIGYIGGFLLALISLPLPALLAILIGIPVIAAAAWLSVNRVRGKRVAPLSLAEEYAGWADTACPVCITLAHLQARAESRGAADGA